MFPMHRFWKACQRSLLVTALALVPHAVQAAVPTSTSIEGALSSAGGGPAADGSYNVVFSIYKDASGGSAAYSEAGSIAVKGGLFTYQLGSKTPLTATVLANLPTAFLGLKIDLDPELPRQPLNSTPFALRAGVAEGLECSGCVAETELDPAILAAFTKTSALPAVAKSGNYADLIGTPPIPVVSAAGKSGSYLDLTNLPVLATVAKSGNYADLIGAPVLSKVATSNKYADLTGLPTLAALGTSCGTGLAVKGLKADGSLDCVAAGSGPVDPKNLPADGIDEISNGLINNQFQDTINGKLAIPIDDNKPTGTSDVLAFPNIGTAQNLTVNIDITNSDISSLSIKLFDPNGLQYDLCGVEKITVDGLPAIKTPCGPANSKTFKTSFPVPTATEKGDLTTWVGKNPVGNWSITVIDTKYLNNAMDGTINSWGITLQTLSNQKINVAGNLLVTGDVTVGGKLLGVEIPKPATYRWAAFNTYQEQGEGWMAAAQGNGNGEPSFFGGVTPQAWTDGNATAGSMSADKEVLRTLFQNKGYAKANATMWSEVFLMYSSTNSRVFLALFRVRNNTSADIQWKPTFRYTSWSGWGEQASLAINGANAWTGDCGTGTCTATPTVTIPKNRVSTVIAHVTASNQVDIGYNVHVRKSFLAFYNNTLLLPAGLEFIDDLDTATGGWDK